MALNCRRFTTFAVILTSIALSCCTNKETSSGSANSGNSTTPATSLAMVSGRVEFAPAANAAKASVDPKFAYYTNRIIVKFKEGVEKTSFDSIPKEPGISTEATRELSVKEVQAPGENAREWTKKSSTRMFEIKNPRNGEAADLSISDIKRAVRLLSKDQRVEYASPEYMRRAFLQMNRSVEQWNFRDNFMNMGSQRWGELLGEESKAKKIRVAVIDTGYKPHLDLEGKVRVDLGFDFISDEYLAADGDDTEEKIKDREIDPNPLDMGSDPEGFTSVYHGTFVSGIIAAQRNGNGIDGIADNVDIIPVRVLGRDGMGSDFDIAQGIRYAAGLDNVSGKVLSENERAQVINLSLGGEGEAPIIHEALKDAIKNGVSVICASGNSALEGRGSIPNYPAAYDECVGVGALKPTFQDEDYKVAGYSNYGPNVDIVAPGGFYNPEAFFDEVEEENGDMVEVKSGVLSTVWTNEPECKGTSLNSNDYSEDCSDFAYSSGTSFATPHVAATVALIKSVNPSVSPYGIMSILYRTALGEDSTVKDEFKGWGVLNALDAVSAAKNLLNVKEEIILQLKDPKTYRIISTSKTDSSNDFSFKMENVQSGDYVIHAGTDFDGDGIYCEKGEKFGVYPEPDQGAVFHIDQGENVENMKITLRTFGPQTVCPE